jgi:hypothetical protein
MRTDWVTAIATTVDYAGTARLDGHLTRTDHAVLIAALEPFLAAAGATWDDIAAAMRSRHT